MTTTITARDGASLTDRVDTLDWASLAARLDADGFAITERVLTRA